MRNVSELVTGQFHSATQLSLAPCIGKVNTIMELKAEELELISAHSILGRDILAQIFCPMDILAPKKMNVLSFSNSTQLNPLYYWTMKY